MKKQDQFIGDLLACIGGEPIYPATATLVMSAWNKLNKNERRFLTGGKFDAKANAWATPNAPNRT